MAEMLVQSESLTSIADKIRVLSGTEDAMGLDAMANRVGEANTNVNTEAGLIEQISSALEGKAAGGSGDSGGGSVETCTVTVENWLSGGGGGYYYNFIYLDSLLNPIIEPLQSRGWVIEPEIHTYTVAKGTVVFCESPSLSSSTPETSTTIFNPSDSTITHAVVVNGDCTLMLG